MSTQSIQSTQQTNQSNIVVSKLHQRNTSTIEISRDYLNIIKEIAFRKHVKVRDILNSILDAYFNNIYKNEEDIIIKKIVE